MRYPKFSMRRLMVVVTVLCLLFAVGAWLGPSVAVAIAGGPMAVAVAASNRSSKSAAVDIWILVLLCGAAVAAAPLLYEVRHQLGRGPASTAASFATVLLFAAAPSCAGILRGEPSPLATCVAAGLCLTPAAHNLLDPFDYVPEVIFLASASFVAFVSAGWVGSLVRSQKWLGAICASLFLLVGDLAVALEAWVILYFE